MIAGLNHCVSMWVKLCNEQYYQSYSSCRSTCNIVSMLLVWITHSWSPTHVFSHVSHTRLQWKPRECCFTAASYRHVYRMNRKINRSIYNTLPLFQQWIRGVCVVYRYMYFPSTVIRYMFLRTSYKLLNLTIWSKYVTVEAALVWAVGD